VNSIGWSPRRDLGQPLPAAPVPRRTAGAAIRRNREDSGGDRKTPLNRAAKVSICAENKKCCGGPSSQSTTSHGLRTAIKNVVSKYHKSEGGVMASGRKRKFGKREKNGNLQRPSKIERESFQRRMEQVEMQTVLAQPHRRGNTDQRCESALGRFSIANPKLRRELFDAASDYAGLKRRWRAAKGVPGDVRLGADGSGAGPCEATVRAWEAQIAEIETAIVRDSPLGFAPFKWLVLDDRDIDRRHDIAVCFALRACAVAAGKISANIHPFF